MNEKLGLVARVIHVAASISDYLIPQGKVVFVNIGATAVGSIVQLQQPGDEVQRTGLNSTVSSVLVQNRLSTQNIDRV